LSSDPKQRFDAIFVGAGIMSATLAVLLHEIDPEMRLLMIERLSEPGLESSAALNNAGTGHAGNCELNYTPLNADGTIDIEKALNINSSFEQSLELWASLAALGRLNPKEFLNKVPHISFVWGDKSVAFLKKRFEELSSFKPFSQMQFSNEFPELKEWMPLVMDGRTANQEYAATRIDRGTDIDFGALTSAYLKPLLREGALELRLESEVVSLNRANKKIWQLDVIANSGTENIVEAPFVFVGSGGRALTLLQKSKIPEGQNYGGFPISGKWLVCSDPTLSERHNAKVYGMAKVGSPPMSVPHLDTRWVSGNRSLLFGPFAGFSSKFLKQGSYLDLFQSISKKNIFSMLDVGFKNLDLVQYLGDQLLQSDKDRLRSLQEFFPKAKEVDWQLLIAGQRVQIIKRSLQGGVLKMGTELVSSSDGSITALLGASPGASTAVSIMLEVLKISFADKMANEDCQNQIKKLVPSFASQQSSDRTFFEDIRQRNNSELGLA